MFVNLSREVPVPLRDWFRPLLRVSIRFERHEMQNLVSIHQTETVVAANWKILIENYNECLHCPIVHPELVEIVPTYRTGNASDHKRLDGGVLVTTGGTSYSNQSQGSAGRSPRHERGAGALNFWLSGVSRRVIDVAGSNVVATRLVPEGPTQTRVLTDYLFMPEDIASDDFYQSRSLSSVSSWPAGLRRPERVQRGITSRGLAMMCHPAKDEYVHLFNEYYRR